MTIEHPFPDTLALSMVKALNATGMPYMLVGSLSSNVYGVSRPTHDADLVIETDEKIPDLAAKLAPLFTREMQMGFDTLQGTMRHRFRSADGRYMVECFLLSEDPHDRARFERRRCIERDGVAAWFPSPEDVVLQKLRWARPKDLEDIRGVLAVQAGRLDMAYLTQWCEKHGTLAQLRASIASLPAGMWVE